MNAVLKWLSKPTSKAGAVAIVSAVSSALGGATTWLHAVPLMAFGVAMIAFPDNSVAQKDVEALVSSVVNDAVAARAPVAPHIIKATS